MDPIQVVLVLSQLLAIKKEHSNVLLFKQEDVLPFFINQMKVLLRSASGQLGLQLIRSFLPQLCIYGYPNGPTIDLLT